MGRLPMQTEDSIGFPGQEAWLNHFYPGLETLFKYLPKNGFITAIDPHHLKSISKKIHEKLLKDVEKYRKEAAEKNMPFPDIKDNFIPYQAIAKCLEGHQRLELRELDMLSDEAAQNKIHIMDKFHLDDDLDICLTGKGRVSMSPLAEKIAEWLASRARVVLVSRTEQQANRLKEILKNYEVQVNQVVQIESQKCDFCSRLQSQNCALFHNLFSIVNLHISLNLLIYRN